MYDLGHMLRISRWRRIYPSSSRHLVPWLGILLPLASATAAAQELIAPGGAAFQSDAPTATVALASVTRRGDRYFAPLEGGGEVVLTLAPRLQEAAEEVLATYDVP